MKKNYKVLGGMSFDERTPDAVCRILSEQSRQDTRLRLFYGDADTGRDWMEEHDTIGHIGRSCGEIKIPLLIPRSTSTGGGAILDHCLVRIIADGRELYRHPKYHQPEIVITHHDNSVYFDTALHAHFDSYSQAKRYADFMTGKRNTKGGR